jgi:hypothetical protein
MFSPSLYVTVEFCTNSKVINSPQEHHPLQRVICDKSVDMIALSTAGVAQPKLRPTALFVVNAGSAIIAATVLAEWLMALDGATTAMVLSFADDEGPLSARAARHARASGPRCRRPGTPNSGQAREKCWITAAMTKKRAPWLPTKV